MATWNLGQRLASALPSYEKEFKAQVFDNTVVLNYMKENGGIEEKSGGTSVRVPLNNAASNTTWFQGEDTFDVSNVDVLDAAEYSWRNITAPIVITLDDELNNTGREQVIDILAAKVEVAKNSLSASLNDALFTGVAASKQIDGLQTLVGAGTAGGIAGATFADWRSYVESTSTALTIAQMKTARNTINQGKGGSPVGMIVTTQPLYEKYESTLTPSYQMNPMVTSKEAKRIGDVGFVALEYAGIPVTYDLDCASGEMYFLNTKNLKLYVHKDAYMKKTDTVSPGNQHVDIQTIVMRCALGSNRRKSLGKLTAKTA